MLVSVILAQRASDAIFGLLFVMQYGYAVP